MELEKLPRLPKALIGENLSGKDLVALCATSKEMRKICTSKDYNNLWILKIKEDFDIDYIGNDAYNEYMRLTIRYSIDYYILHLKAYSFSFKEDVYMLFDNQDKAIKYALELQADRFLGKPFNYNSIKKSLDRKGSYSQMNLGIFIRKTKLHLKHPTPEELINMYVTTDYGYNGYDGV